ncbi:MAG: putative quinol monooxygenase [Singulisphaera sp.]
MIHVIATIHLTPGRRTEFLKEFHALVPLVKAEKGCIDYGPTVDVASGIPVQGALRDDVVTVVEKWQDLDCLRAHLVAPHMQTYRTKVKDLVRDMQLQVLEPA